MYMLTIMPLEHAALVGCGLNIDFVKLDICKTKFACTCTRIRTLSYFIIPVYQLDHCQFSSARQSPFMPCCIQVRRPLPLSLREAVLDAPVKFARRQRRATNLLERRNCTDLLEDRFVQTARGSAVQCVKTVKGGERRDGPSALWSCLIRQE
jgi:hypothetical protein